MSIFTVLSFRMPSAVSSLLISNSSVRLYLSERCTGSWGTITTNAAVFMVELPKVHLLNKEILIRRWTAVV